MVDGDRIMVPSRLILKIVELTMARVARNDFRGAAGRREFARRLFHYHEALSEYEALCAETGQTLSRLQAVLRHKYPRELHLEEWEACRLEFISDRLAQLTGSLVGIFEDDLEAGMMAMGGDGGQAFQDSQIYDQALAEFIEAAHAQDMDAAYAAGQLARLFIWEDQSSRRLRLAVPVLSEPKSWWGFYAVRAERRVLPLSCRKIQSPVEVAELESTFDETVLRIRELRESVASFLRANVTIEEIL